jgi:DnaJ domain
VPSDVPAGHGDAARELRGRRGGHALYGSAAGRGNAHLRPRQVDKPTTRKAGDFPLLLIHPTRGDCSPRPHVSNIRRLTHAATPAPPAHQSRGPDGTAPSRCGPGRTAAGDHDHNRLDAIMTTEPTDLYAILGLNRHATQAQISHAYRTLLRRYHPDTRTPGDPSQDAVSDAALQQVLTAYEVLRDPGRRADYDQRYTTQLSPTRPSPTIAEAEPVFVSWTGPVDEPPLRAGPVRWNPWPTP